MLLLLLPASPMLLSMSAASAALSARPHAHMSLASTSATTELELLARNCWTAGAGTFSCPLELERALVGHGVDTALWGRGAARTASSLLRELENGESILTFGPSAARRWVNVAKVCITPWADDVSGPSDELQLIELFQSLPDGRLRRRGRPLSEKLTYREAPLEAALRGLREELGGFATVQNVLLDASSLRQWRETRDSDSYPTLLSHYNLHEFQARVRDLPTARFQTSEAEEGGRLVHVWDWVPRDRSRRFGDLATVMWH